MKNFVYSALTAEKSLMSARRTVVLTTLSKVQLAASRMKPKEQIFIIYVQESLYSRIRKGIASSWTSPSHSEARECGF